MQESPCKHVLLLLLLLFFLIIVIIIIIIIFKIATEDACLLGSSLGTGRALDKALSSICSDLRIAIGRLKVLPSYDALILLRSSLSVSRLKHILRCVPCSGPPFLTVFDNLCGMVLAA